MLSAANRPSCLRHVVFFASTVFLGALTVPAADAPAAMPKLALPTANDALYRGDGEAFYQYVQRDFKGEITYPWEGGQYGFVRTPVETPEGIVLVHFHEGVDIKPLKRDPKGEPLDDILAIAAGRVVHCSEV